MPAAPRAILASCALALAALCAWPAPAQAVPTTSLCLAVAERLAPLMPVPVVYRPAALEKNEVRLTFVGHSTFLIESPAGVKIATDYAGYSGGVLPDVVTMNHAHESHYTDYPDPQIKYVLRGWNPNGGHAEHDLVVQDVHIRNVPTNIRRWYGGGTEEFGNSIFIFEVAGLCIGHLGHLHHELTDQQLGQIGQLDVVLAPVDGSYTLDLPGMVNVLKALHARLVIPMHYFGAGTLQRFLDGMSNDFEVRTNEAPTIVLSRAHMPDKPQILVLPGH